MDKAERLYNLACAIFDARVEWSGYEPESWTGPDGDVYEPPFEFDRALALAVLKEVDTW